MRVDAASAGSTYQSQSGSAQSAAVQSNESNELKVQKANVAVQAKQQQQRQQELAQQEEPVKESEVIKAIEQANKHIRTFDRRLEFAIHDSTKQIMVKVINTADDSVIREIPSEKVLDMVAHMWEVAGILVDERR